MLVLKKKEIIASALVVLIGVAGYLNWSYQDTIRVTDNADYTQTGKKLGEAKYVANDKKDVESNESEDVSQTLEYFTMARMEKDNSRSKSLEILNKTAENQGFDEETRKNAQQKILDIASNIEKETVIENIAKAKGYEEISVYIDGENVDIIVKKKDFSEKDVNVLKSIVSEQLNISGNNIKIVEKK